MKSESPIKTYRKAIKTAWLEVVGRQNLASAEYELIKQWVGDDVPLEVVLKAIQVCARRAAEKSITIYSLGVIRADVKAILKQRARTHVGAHTPKKEPEWLTAWRRDLPLLIEGETNERRRAAYEFLLEELPNLSWDQAKARKHYIEQIV